MRVSSFCHTCALVLCLVWLPSCDDGLYDVPDVKPPIIQKPEPTLGFSSKVQTGNNPNQYSVSLTWRGTFQPGSWVVRRSEEKGKPTVLEALPVGSASFEDKTPTAGQVYRYELGSNGRDGFYPLAEATVQLPKDLVVKGRMALKESGPFNRAFFNENAVLDANGAPLRLEVNEIISQYGSIETFPEGKKALSGITGKTPGDIVIRAKRGTGRLRINARGEAGEDGVDGRNGVKGTTGSTGTPGDWGMNPELYKHFFANFIDSFERAMRRSPRPPGDPEWHYTFGNMRRFVCARPPGDGGRGANGSDALDGGDGGTGGNSGRVLVEIAEGNLLVTVHSHPGNSGLGGRLGKGGEGGDGGASGRLDDGHLCPAARAGERGSPGLDGRQGRPGERGAVGPSCVRIGLNASGDCAHFNSLSTINR